MSLILGILFTAVAAVAGTILCPSPSSSPNRNRIPGLALALVALVALNGRPAVAGDLLQGSATVIDGSTLAIAGVPVKLFGIVTPASDATCWDANEAPYTCGRQVTAELTAHIGTERLICERSGQTDDRSGTAVCRMGDEDLGNWMIARGYAMPTADAPGLYKQAGDHAWGQRAGLWAGVFDDPKTWRHAAR
ncbi:thermonuclease family protein [Methylobacterium persicinum]|uniref:Endonuclease YncB(Thermonuclease family) n=1 Tax=Methylobacterium persicinum TaxID=374426 RepID=A0ABU0HMB4_9HYPH|nr:thermonuclease family protein [Methylobacterium persicinum]MDQ0442646.1 endonuclease YncB(thermonuclease family) [Methylobacterium persicinum]GJE37107.1 hypothetical protein KHHGKMAE_1163 [Methylobacterium persicinum]